MARDLLASNPFVRAKWRAAGVRSVYDLVGWYDFGRRPETRKDEFVEDQAAHPPFGTNLTYPLERYVRVHQTSGTSGHPIRWLETPESWEWWARCWAFVLRGAGVEPADRVFFPFSFGLFIGFWAGFEGARALGALAIPGVGQDSATRLGWMQALGATALVCTPSYALHLIEVARERGQDPSKGSVRITVHAGEPGASIPAVRARIEAGWGCRAYDHAGMTEVGAYAYECAEQAGLHVNESEFVAEVIDPTTGAPARDGELVLTNLGRVGSPVIRYRTGDRGRAASCGERRAREHRGGLRSGAPNGRIRNFRPAAGRRLDLSLDRLSFQVTGRGRPGWLPSPGASLVGSREMEPDRKEAKKTHAPETASGVSFGSTVTLLFSAIRGFT